MHQCRHLSDKQNDPIDERLLGLSLESNADLTAKVKRRWEERRRSIVPESLFGQCVSVERHAVKAREQAASHFSSTAQQITSTPGRGCQNPRHRA